MADDIVIGAKQLPNPTGIKVKADTDPPDVEPTSVGGDISNPAPAQVLPAKVHPLEKFHAKAGRQTAGKNPDVKISEN